MGKNAPPPPAPEPVVEEPVIEYEDPTYLDNLWNNEDDLVIDAGLLSTLTFKNGLMIRMLNTGDVLQTTDEKARGIYPDGEKDRIFTGKGSVIRHLADGNIEILHFNGNRSFF